MTADSELDCRAENVVLKRELYRLQEFAKQVMAPPLPLIGPGVMRQDGDGIQRQLPRIQPLEPINLAGWYHG